jgi:hypothetical protein
LNLGRRARRRQRGESPNLKEKARAENLGVIETTVHGSAAFFRQEKTAEEGGSENWDIL